MPTLLPLSAISEFVAEADSLSADHPKLAAFTTAHKFVCPSPPPADPYSAEYRDFQIGLWQQVAGRASYQPGICELNDNLPAVDRIQYFYPFASRSAQETGNYFLGAAMILKKLGLPPGSRVVEYGVGWGHTTRLLANFGYEVTAVDIERRYLDLLAPYSLPGCGEIATICAPFETAEFPPASLDGVVFFECFHHCMEYAELIAKLAVYLKPGGRIVFCAESFYEDWFDFPWGLRLDGHSVWAIRHFGWLELGFRKTFIAELLNRNGFTLEWSSIPEIGPYAETLVAVKR